MADSDHKPGRPTRSNKNSQITPAEFVTGTRQRVTGLYKNTYSLVCCYQIYHHTIESMMQRPELLTLEGRHGLATIHGWLLAQGSALIEQCTDVADWIDDVEVEE